MKSVYKQVTLIALTATLFVLFELNIGKAPALGKFFSPFHGFWQNIEPLTAQVSWTLSGKDSDIQVLKGKDGIPHVFAESDRDLAFGQGYITAVDRLFEVDLQTKMAAGRISEVAGASTVPLDVERRSIGMVWAAERMVQKMSEDPATWAFVTSYVEGFNFRLSELSSAQWPVEYKIMGFSPEPLSPLKVALYAKEMSKELSTLSEDLRMTNNRLFLGDKAIEELFSNPAKALQPIVRSEGAKSNNDAIVSQMPVVQQPFEFEALLPQPNPGNGSNNWAISGSKSLTGKPILADDPHLTIRLPSIWYQIQMVSKTMNVLGSSLPGLPSVVVGTNSKVAWGVTNGGTDVVDWFKIQFKDDTKSKYLFDGKWEESTFRTEKIRIKGEKDRDLKITYTRHGPVAKTLPDGTSLAMRWSAHDPSNEIKGFLDLNKANSISEAATALGQFSSPTQNFALISDTGDIGMVHAGKIPKKWKNQGLFILDGTRSDHLWTEYLPFSDSPKEFNPTRGFVSSANQSPVDGNYPHYVGGFFNATSEARASRIQEMLVQKSDWTAADFVKMQTDTLDKISEEVLPTLLHYLEKSELNDSEKVVLNELKNWNFQKVTETKAAVFFEKWFRAFRETLWGEWIPAERGQFPHLDQFVSMVTSNPSSAWFDSPKTSQSEDISFWILKTFKETNEKMIQLNGPFGEKWSLGLARPSNILHLARIPGFGKENLSLSGGSTSINAMNKSHGPSMRMVSTFNETGPSLQMILAGGNSGNPGALSYDDEYKIWESGNLKQLDFYKSFEAAKVDLKVFSVAKGNSPPEFGEKIAATLASLPWYAPLIVLGAVLFSAGVLIKELSFTFQNSLWSRIIFSLFCGVCGSFLWALPALFAKKNGQVYLLQRITGMFGLKNVWILMAITGFIPFLLLGLYTFCLMTIWKNSHGATIKKVLA